MTLLTRADQMGILGGSSSSLVRDRPKSSTSPAKGNSLQRGREGQEAHSRSLRGGWGSWDGPLWLPCFISNLMLIFWFFKIDRWIQIFEAICCIFNVCEPVWWPVTDAMQNSRRKVMHVYESPLCMSLKRGCVFVRGPFIFFYPTSAGCCIGHYLYLDPGYSETNGDPSQFFSNSTEITKVPNTLAWKWSCTYEPRLGDPPLQKKCNTWFNSSHGPSLGSATPRGQKIVRRGSFYTTFCPHWGRWLQIGVTWAPEPSVAFLLEGNVDIGSTEWVITLHRYVVNTLNSER